MEHIIANCKVPLTIVTFVYVAVLIFVFLDLWAGIRKAKQRGEYRSSFGLRKTIAKIANYYNALLVISVIDALQMLTITETQLPLPTFPFLTIFGGLFVGFIELKSVYEKNSDKEKAMVQEAAKLVAQLITNGKDNEGLASLIEYLKTKDKNGAES